MPPSISMNSTEERPLSVLLRGPEVAKTLGISRALAYRWMSLNILPVVRVPGSKAVRVPRAALMRWVDERTEGGVVEVSA